MEGRQMVMVLSPRKKEVNNSKEVKTSNPKETKPTTAAESQPERR